MELFETFVNSSENAKLNLKSTRTSLLTRMLKKSDQRCRANDAAIQPIGLPPTSAGVERTFLLHHFRKVRQSI